MIVVDRSGGCEEEEWGVRRSTLGEEEDTGECVGVRVRWR